MFALAAGCAGTPAEEASDSQSGEIRALRSNEIVGVINYGDEIAFNYTASPTYRAYRYRLSAYDSATISVSTTDTDRKVYAELLNANMVSIQRGTPASTIRLGHTAGGQFEDFYVVVREDALRPAQIKIKLTSDGIREPIANDFGYGATGDFASPRNLVGQTFDVPMNCTIRTTTGVDPIAVLTLKFETNGVSIVGADSFLTDLQTSGLTSSRVETKTASVAYNYGRDFFRVTTVSADTARLELSHYDSSFTRSCIALAKL